MRHHKSNAKLTVLLGNAVGRIALLKPGGAAFGKEMQPPATDKIAPGVEAQAGALAAITRAARRSKED